MKFLNGLVLAALIFSLAHTAQAQGTGAGPGGYNYPYIPVVDEINNCMAWLLTPSRPSRPAPRPKEPEISVAAEVCIDMLVKDPKPSRGDPKKDAIKRPNLGLGGVISK